MTSTDKHASTWALVPLKSSERAKSRLAEILDPEQRAQLFYAMAERVIVALRASKGIDAVAVVTASREVAAFARTLGATPILQNSDVGMSPALQSALRVLQPMQPARVLMVPGDLPLISSAAVDAVLAAADSDASIVLVPDRRREGTNALLCTPPDALAPHFGGCSFERHLAAAKASGIATHIIEIEEFALDLDCPDDLTYLHRHRDQRAAQLLATLHAATVE
jgi:2-phospho-L-lactate/phosphoenolpyruvate guanylyltransferase